MLWKRDMLFRILAPGSGIAVSATLIVGFGIYYSIRVWTDTLAIVLQSMTKLLPLWLSVPVQAALSIGVQWYCVPRYGLYGVLAGLIVSFVLTVAWVFPLVIRREARRRAESIKLESVSADSLDLYSDT
jgi:hypothetical protein